MKTRQSSLSKISLLIALGIAAIPSLAKAEVGPSLYFTDFYGPGYTADAPINGQDGWYSSSVNNPGPGAVRYLDLNAGTGNQPNTFVLGGTPYASVINGDQNTYPTAPMTTILRDVPVNYNSIYFDSIFSIAPGSGAKDSFGWTVFNAEGFYLMDIILKSTITTNGSVAYNIGAVSYANDSQLQFQQLYRTDGQPVTPLRPNEWFHLGFDIWDIGTTNQSVGLWSYNLSGTNTTTPTFLSRTAIAGTDFSAGDYNNGNTNISSIGISWILSNTSNQVSTNGNTVYTAYGNNTLLTQTLGVAVPEPQTWALFALSGVIMVIALRRKANS